MVLPLFISLVIDPILIKENPACFQESFWQLAPETRIKSPQLYVIKLSIF